jgi:formyltetrahydrofolate hydrolase
MNIYRLLISCPDAHGLVAKVSQFIFERNGNLPFLTHAHGATNLPHNVMTLSP